MLEGLRIIGFRVYAVLREVYLGLGFEHFAIAVEHL